MTNNGVTKTAFIVAYALIVGFVAANDFVVMHVHSTALDETYENFYIVTLGLSIVLWPFALTALLKNSTKQTDSTLQGKPSTHQTSPFVRTLGISVCVLELIIVASILT